MQLLPTSANGNTRCIQICTLLWVDSPFVMRVFNPRMLQFKVRLIQLLMIKWNWLQLYHTYSSTLCGQCVSNVQSFSVKFTNRNYKCLNICNTLYENNAHYCEKLLLENHSGINGSLLRPQHQLKWAKIWDLGLVRAGSNLQALLISNKQPHKGMFKPPHFTGRIPT